MSDKFGDGQQGRFIQINRKLIPKKVLLASIVLVCFCYDTIRFVYILFLSLLFLFAKTFKLHNHSIERARV